MQVLYRLSYVGSETLPDCVRPCSGTVIDRGLRLRGAGVTALTKLLERETGFEPATLSLEG